MPKKAQRTRLTPEKVDSLSTSKTRTFVYDARSPLVVKLTAKGGRSFMVRQRRPGGGVIEKVLPVAATGENLPAARHEAQRLSDLIEAGKDPRAPEGATQGEQGAVWTLRDAFKRTIAEKRRTRASGTVKQYEDALAAFERFAWDTLDEPLGQIERPTLDTALRNVRAGFERRQAARGRAVSGASEHRRVWAAVRAVVATAAREGAVNEAQADDLRRIERPEVPHSAPDPLEPAEIGRLWATVTGSDWSGDAGPVDALVAFILATGCRPGEARKLTWGNVVWSGERARIVLPAENVKTRASRAIPLTCALVTLLERLPKGTEDAPVFTADGRRALNPYLSSSRRQRAHRAGLEREFDFYALRDTVKNEMLFEIEASETVANVLLGHNLRGVDPHYVASGRAYEKMQCALTAWHNRLEALAAQ